MSQKEPRNRAVKDDHFDVLVVFHRCDSLVELWNSVRAEDIEGRVINRYAPVRRRSSRQKNLFSHRRVVHLQLLVDERSDSTAAQGR